MLPEIQKMTAAAASQVEPLVAQLDALEEDSPEHAHLQASVSLIVSAWAEAVRDFGAEAKGVWLVDFDTGNGYYCWKHPEATLSHYHGYEDGFAGRMKIV